MSIGPQHRRREASSRRAFLKLSSVGLAGGSAALIGACGNGKKATTSVANGPDAQGGADVVILNRALDLENTAIAAYTAGLPLLTGGLRATAKHFLMQEMEHADGLSTAIKSLGGTPNQPKGSYDFGKLKHPTDALELANALEHTAVRAYLAAIPKLGSPDLRATAASIVTAEAEHITVLLTALKKPPVPAAFVTGRVS